MEHYDNKQEIELERYEIIANYFREHPGRIHPNRDFFYSLRGALERITSSQVLPINDIGKKAKQISNWVTVAINKDIKRKVSRPHEIINFNSCIRDTKKGRSQTSGGVKS